MRITFLTDIENTSLSLAAAGCGLAGSRNNQLSKLDRLSFIRIGDELPSYVVLAAWGYGSFCRLGKAAKRVCWRMIAMRQDDRLGIVEGP